MLLTLVLTVPAFAAGEPNITVNTTMKELRANESIQGSGYYTYSREQDSVLLEKLYENWTLEEYAGKTVAQDCADGLNLVIENYNNGVQVTHKVYSQEEIQQNSDLDKVELFYFPAETQNAKCVLVVPGGANHHGAEVKEGTSTAARLHELGYAVFVLRYRVWTDAADNAPVQDVGRAVQYIVRHAADLGIDAEDYAMLGYSSGGQLVGLFGTDEMGYKNYDVPKPGLLILSYAINDFAGIKPLYHLVLDFGSCGQRYYDLAVSDYVTEDYPSVYHWFGKNDLTLGVLYKPAQGYALDKALEEYGIPHKMVVYDDARHAIGTGIGTGAEGWLSDAAAYWEEIAAEKKAG